MDGATSNIQTQLNNKLSMSAIDASGDLLIGNANDSVTRLPVGSDYQVLTVNTNVPNKVEWASISYDSDQAVLAAQVFA